MKTNSTHKKNIAFDKLSAPEKRVAIAKDVIKQVRVGKYKPFAGKYGSFAKKNSIINLAYVNESFKQAICDDDAVTCSVCAKGTLFVSYISKVNDFMTNNFRGIGHDSTSHKKLKELFSAKQLSLIEGCFEGTIIDGELRTDKSEKTAEEFYEKYPDTNKRLLVIMRNIIRNSGTFKP